MNVSLKPSSILTLNTALGPRFPHSQALCGGFGIITAGEHSAESLVPDKHAIGGGHQWWPLLVSGHRSGIKVDLVNVRDFVEV